MNIIRNLALGLAFSLAGTGAHAQSEPQTATVVETRIEPATQDAVLERRNALARELIDLSAGPNFMKEFERVMGEQLAEIDSKGGEEAAWVRANMPPMLNRMVTRLMDQMAPVYAAIYTEEELRGQIDFYRSPVGRAIAAKTVSLGLALQEAETTLLVSLMTEMESKYCARFDCGDPGRTASKPAR